MGGDWTSDEVRRTVEDYFEMLRLELKGESYNKTEHRARLLKRLHQRSPSAVERKHQNIIAILSEFGWPAIDGYKPLGNYQRLLGDGVIEYLDRDPTTLALIEETAATVPDQVPDLANNMDSVVVAPPDPLPARIKTRATLRPRVPRRMNFDLLDATKIGDSVASANSSPSNSSEPGYLALGATTLPDWSIGFRTRKGMGRGSISSPTTRRAVTVSSKSRQRNPPLKRSFWWEI